MRFIKCPPINKKNRIASLCLCLIFLISNCVDRFTYSDDRLTITNKSNLDISVLYSNHKDLYLTENAIDYYLRDDNRIKTDSTYILRKRGATNEWDNYIKDGPEKKLFIYIFAVDTLIAYNNVESMDELCYHHKYLKEFEYTAQQLINNRWRVIFDTPTAR